MKDLYTITLNGKQVAKACENYVLGPRPVDQVVARAEVLDGLLVNVRVSTKRKPRDKTAEAKQAGVRG